MNIPPLRSRTPPPLCDSENNDNDDSDFGNFAMCSDIGGDSYDDFQSVEKTVGVEDSASEDSGLCTSSSIGQAHSPYETSPTTGPKGLPNGEAHLFESLPMPETLQEQQHPEQHTICDTILIGEVDEEAQIEVQEIQNVEEKIELTGHLVLENSLAHENHDEIPQTTNNEEPSTVVSTSKTSDEATINEINEFAEDQNSDYEDFQVFEGLETNTFTTAPEISATPAYSYFNQPDRNSLTEIPSEKNTSITENWDQISTQSQDFESNQQIVEDDTDEFSEFQTSSFIPSLPVHTEKKQNSELPPLFPEQFFQAGEDEDRFKEDVSCVNMNSIVIPFLKDLVYQSQVWSHLYTLDDTPALRYQWASSSCNRRLLTALKIDSRNILCSFWNKSMKTGVVENSSSLDLVKLGSDCKEPTKNQYIPKNIVPDAHFDWDGSGLTNPLDCGSTTLLDMPHLSFTCASKSIPAESPFSSCESFQPFHSCSDACVSTISEFKLEFGPSKISQQAEEILSSLPDRSYLKKTYIVFKKIP